MDLSEPVRCRVEVESGRLTGGSGRYEKRLSDSAAFTPTPAHSTRCCGREATASSMRSRTSGRRRRPAT